MVNEKDLEEFVNQAEEAIARRGESALRGAEKFLDPEHWLKWCDTTAEFYVAFCDQVERSLVFMVAHQTTQRPDILNFLLTTDLEGRFPPLDIQHAGFGVVSWRIRYLMAQALVARLAERETGPDLAASVDTAFDALWEILASDEPSGKERWQAYESILQLAMKNYDGILKSYDESYRFDLAAQEDSNRTLIKACYLLSQVTTGAADDDVKFGVATHDALLRFYYYLWLVNDDPSAWIDLVPLALICHLRHDIMAPGTPYDFVSSMAPRAVIDELRSLRSA